MSTKRPSDLPANENTANNAANEEAGGNVQLTSQPFACSHDPWNILRQATRMLYRHFFRVLPEECTRPRRGEAKEKKKHL